VIFASPHAHLRLHPQLELKVAIRSYRVHDTSWMSMGGVLGFAFLGHARDAVGIADPFWSIAVSISADSLLVGAAEVGFIALNAHIVGI
jgi:hypothetical protein